MYRMVRFWGRERGCKERLLKGRWKCLIEEEEYNKQVEQRQPRDGNSNASDGEPPPPFIITVSTELDQGNNPRNDGSKPECNEEPLQAG